MITTGRAAYVDRSNPDRAGDATRLTMLEAGEATSS